LKNISTQTPAGHVTLEVERGEECMALEGYPDLLSVEDLTKIFGVSKQTIYKEIKAGKFGTPINIGRAFKIPRVYILDKFILKYQ
jgi:hypothetical protein